MAGTAFAVDFGDLLDWLVTTVGLRRILERPRNSLCGTGAE
jgi:hypothetical protein